MAIVLLVGGWGISRQLRSKEQVLVSAFDALFSASSFHTTTSLVLNLPERLRNSDRPFTKVTVRVEGDVLKSSDSTPELTGKLLIEARGRGNIFFANGDVRILRDEVLFNLKNLPVFLNPSGSLVHKWTRVEAPLLQTSNGEEVKAALNRIGSAVSYTGTETIDATSLWHYHGSLTAEQQQDLQAVLRQNVSNNRALGVVARLLRSNTVDAVDVWVDPSSKQVRQIIVHFTRPLAEGHVYDLGLLTLTFSDYQKNVVIDRPATTVSVRPEVFARIFGSGDVEELQSE